MNITNFVFGLQSKKLSNEVTESLKLLSCSCWAYIGVLVQSPLLKCLRNDFLIFSSLRYGSPTCVCILSLFDSTSMLNTSTTGFSIVCMYFVFYWKSILLQKNPVVLGISTMMLLFDCLLKIWHVSKILEILSGKHLLDTKICESSPRLDYFFVIIF